ncbi:hypothetical protein G8C92_22470 [Paenibacillus donghaensis]|uniref:hypothetical protein n=1 Tax=Paenibacillus donghaensis TaxID=414771 RepID=UPI0018831832|nr:hypothetical protein [Paenibacillus donghaensis]MBE9916787.1 hypothetical protein [Paenibacillus donghaensis]
MDLLKKRSNGGVGIDSYEAEVAFTYKLSEGKLASKGICFVSEQPLWGNFAQCDFNGHSSRYRVILPNVISNGHSSRYRG